jgi:hypothetical protein
MGDKLRYVLSFTDRHGHRRHYYRRRGQKLVPLPGELGSPEFNRAYELASGQKPCAAKKRIRPGSFGAWSPPTTHRPSSGTCGQSRRRATGSTLSRCASVSAICQPR